MPGTEMSTEAQEALASAKLGGIKKQLNAESWSPHMEELMKSWGEKAAGLRFMHSGAAGHWKGMANKLTMYGILTTTIASTGSLISGSIDDPNTKNALIYACAGVGTIATLIQSVKKFYNAEEKAADHGAIAKQFGSLYRYMTLQMGLARGDRVPADELSQWVLKEYERLMQDSPPLGGAQVNAYKAAFKDSDQATPDVCEDEFIINVYSDIPVPLVAPPSALPQTPHPSPVKKVVKRQEMSGPTIVVNKDSSGSDSSS